MWTRRRFLSAAFGTAVLALSRPEPLSACPGPPSFPVCGSGPWLDGGRASVEGYTTRRSYVAGETVTLAMSSLKKTRARVTVERLGLERTVLRSAAVPVQPKPIPPAASEEGCGWEREETGRWSFEIPDEWPSGFYRITMQDLSGGRRTRDGEAWFVVRSAHPDETTTTVLLLVATHTYVAYNNYGARATTAGDGTHGNFYEHAKAASFLRPLPSGFLSSYDCGIHGQSNRHYRYAGWDKWEWPFVRWAEREAIAVDYATQEDLERRPDLLSAYRLVLSVGHDEYWSDRMRNAIDRYVAQGGNAAFFSGNVCYRKVRTDQTRSRLLLEGEMDGTALWSHRKGASRPENGMTGVSFCYGALNPEPVPYKIYQPAHWVFDGLWPGHGKTSSPPAIGCIGYECDGCDLAWRNGVPVPTHRDGTPENFQILGVAPGRMPDYEAAVHSRALFGRDDGMTPWGNDLKQGAAVFGLWTKGGTVLTVGCTEWARHLDDPVVAHITRNILRRLSK
jgi:hypothetical protein